MALNESVTAFIKALHHPLELEITALRLQILAANTALKENIKWNSPNYTYEGNDRITMRVQPAKQLQLIFHCGAKVQDEPEQPLIHDESGLLTWKTTDRAVATFTSMESITNQKLALSKIINDWLKAATR